MAKKQKAELTRRVTLRLRADAANLRTSGTVSGESGTIPDVMLGNSLEWKGDLAKGSYTYRFDVGCAGSTYLIWAEGTGAAGNKQPYERTDVACVSYDFAVMPP